MEFEDILQDVGGFGLYQKVLLIVFLIPTFVLLALIQMGLIFMTSTPEHWCYVPEIANSNLSLEVQKRLVRPPRDSSCFTYDVNYSTILQSGNLTVDPDWSTRRCSDGWEYDTSDYDATAVTRWNMVCQDAHYNNLVLSLMFGGCLIGTPLFGYLSDKIGRRSVFFSLIVLSAVSEITSVFSPNFVLFLLLRTIQGSVSEMICSSSYVLVLELINPDMRNSVTGIAATSWSVGLCLVPLVAWLTRSWIVLSIAATLSAVAIIFYWKLLPESPRWLMSEERYEEAHAIMVKISKTNGKSAHKGNQLMQKIKSLGEKIKKEKLNEDKHSPVEFFKYPTLRKRIILVVICWISVHVTYHGLQINVRNLTGNEFLNFFLVSVVEIPSRLLTWVYLERIGRRSCLVFGFVVTIISLFFPIILTNYPVVGIIGSFFAKGGMSCIYMTLFQLASEIFPTTLRCVGLSLSLSVSSAFAFLVPYIVFLGELETYAPFLIFIIITCIGGICGAFLPETLDKNLPQTVMDAENFEKDFKFWSFFRNNHSEKEKDPNPKEEKSSKLTESPM